MKEQGDLELAAIERRRNMTDLEREKDNPEANTEKKKYNFM